MNTIALNTIEYINELEAAGLDERLAKAHAAALARVIDNNLATKRDIKGLEAATKRDIKELEIATKRDLKELEAATKHDMKQLEMKIAMAKKDTVVQLTIIMAAMMGVYTTVLGIFMTVH